MSETIKLGRKEVKHEDFVNAIKNTDSVFKACELMGVNGTVVTNRNQVKEKAIELDLNMPYFYKYTITEKALKAQQSKIKVFDIDAVNQDYYEAFESSMKTESFPTYKATIGNFLVKLGSVDFAKIFITDITNYCKEKKNAEAHLRSLMIYIVKNNINNAVEKVSKEMLIALIR